MIHAFFDCIIDPESKRYLSEDYFFCRKARDIGLRIWTCPWMQLQHIGAYVFKGSMAHIGSLGAPLTADKTSQKAKKPLTKKQKRNKINR
jgi:GT2 family glycosyltransferase